MPVFTIETPTGRKLDIEAADEASAVRGAQEWDAQNPSDTSFTGAVKQGVGRNLMQAAGETLKQYGPEAAQGAAESLKSKGASLANPNYEPAQVVSDKGVDLTQVPRAVVESSPTLAAALIAARATPGPWWAKALAGGIASTGIGLGDSAKQRAAYRTGDESAEPSPTDKAAALAAGVPEAAVGAVGVGRLLPGAGRAVREVGARGVAEAGKKLGATTAIEGGVEAVQSGINQVGRTAGTDRGLSINQNELANAAVVGGATGGAFAAPRARREAADAMKFRDVDTGVAAEVANRIERVGENLNSASGGFRAVSQVQQDLSNEVRRAGAHLRATGAMTPEADNALRRAGAGDLSDLDVQAIADAAVGTRVEPLVNNLVRQTRALRHLTENFGNFDRTSGTFAGGISGQMDRMRAIYNPVGTAAIGAAHAFVPGLYAMSLPTLGAVGAGYGAARLANRVSGTRSPAKRYVQKFADGTTRVRPGMAPLPQQPTQPPPGPAFPGQTAPAAPGAPWGARPFTTNPTGPRMNPQAAAQPQAPYNAGPGATNVIYGGAPAPQAALPSPSTIYGGAPAAQAALTYRPRPVDLVDQLDNEFRPRNADRASAAGVRIDPALQGQVRAQNLVGQLNDATTTRRGDFPTWPPGRVQRLTVRLMQGATTQQIADEFGLTKNAVIGKIDRLGLREAIKPIQEPPLSDDIVMDVLNEPREIRPQTEKPKADIRPQPVSEREVFWTPERMAKLKQSTAAARASYKPEKAPPVTVANDVNELRKALVASVQQANGDNTDGLDIPEFLRRTPDNKLVRPRAGTSEPAKPVKEPKAPEREQRKIDDATPLSEDRKKELRELKDRVEGSTVKSPEGVSIKLMSHTSKGMSPEDAALHITDMLEATGKFVPDDKGDFITKRLEPMLRWKDETAARLAELTGIEVEVMIPHFRAIPTRTSAREVREELQAFAPQNAKLIGSILGDKVINSRWRKK
jgi:hypothetical protein